MLEVADDRARARAAGKAKEVAGVPKAQERPPLTPEQRKECENVRSKAYHATRKATGDKSLAAIAGMRAKEAYLEGLGYPYKGIPRRPRSEPQAPPGADPMAVAEPPQKKPRSAKQIQYQEKIKEVMAEMKANGGKASIAEAAAILRGRRAADAGA